MGREKNSKNCSGTFIYRNCKGRSICCTGRYWRLLDSSHLCVMFCRAKKLATLYNGMLCYLCNFIDNLFLVRKKVSLGYRSGAPMAVVGLQVKKKLIFGNCVVFSSYGLGLCGIKLQYLDN